MADALYLHYETSARAAVPVDGLYDNAVVAFQNKRVAVLFWSKLRPNDAQIAVVNLSTGDQTPVFTTLLSAKSTDKLSSDESHVWGGSWIPDGRLLVVHGVAYRENDGKPEPALWVLTSSDWIDGSQSGEIPSPIVVLRVDVGKLLASDAQYKATGSGGISTAFFQGTSPNRCFLLTQDAWLLKMEIQVAELLVFARSNDQNASKKAFFKVNSVLKMTNWHAGGITAAAFESSSGTLVVCGGLKNPSEELRQQGASSLSVWHVVAQEPFVELLDYTMVIGFQDDSSESSSTQADRVAAATQKDDGLMHKMRHSFLNPLKMLNGDSEEGFVLPGSIHQLAISTDGVFLSMVDLSGRFRIRQIDACADVLPWQYLQDDASEVEAIAWLGPSSIGFVTRAHQLKLGFLASKETDNEGYENGGDELNESRQHQAGTDVQVVLQRVETDELVASGTTVARQLCLYAPETTDGDSAEIEKFHLQDFRVVVDSRAKCWLVSAVENVASSQLVQKLLQSHQFDKALEMAEQCRGRADWQGEAIDLDHIYQQLWAKYRESATLNHVAPGIAVLQTDQDSLTVGFEKALSRLNAVEHDKEWVVDECLRVVASNSLLDMKEILAAGLQALVAIHHPDPSHEQDRARLLRYLYRLETLKELFIAELDEQDRSFVAEEQCFDGAVFATFRDASILEVAFEFAKEGRLAALEVLFRRNAFNLLPHRTRILELLPVTLSPAAYAHLLPAIRPQDSVTEDEWQFYTLARADGSPRPFVLAEVELIAENRSHDLTPEELSVFEACARQEPHERRDQYALWFTHRIVEMDSMYGQLDSANDLGRFGHACLLGGVEDSSRTNGGPAAVVSSTPLEEFLEHTDRLFKCVHELHLPGCCESSLEDWSLLSVHDQVMAVVMEARPVENPVDALLHRLRTVFLIPRRHAFALDEVVSWLCQVLMSTRSGDNGDAVQTLAFCSQLIHESNPANSSGLRWIQDDARLLRTAIDIVFAASFSTATTDKEEKKQLHQAFVDQLWLIFQSLPERKPDDAPTIAQLQVEVDGMEDLLVSMDVLANYHVLTSPSAIRARVATEEKEDPTGNSQYALQLAEEMGSYGLAHNVHWQTIWQDMIQLKTRVFGERVSQESMLALLLRQLLRTALKQKSNEEDEARESRWADIHDLISNWVVANVSALPQPMDILLKKIRECIEHDQQDHAAKMVALAQSVLGIEVIAETESAKRFATKFHSILGQEQTRTRVRELFDLLSYGAVKVTRSSLRELHAENDRLELILQVFTSNPSHYKMSSKAQQWLREQRGLPEGHALDIVLDGVMYLAQLLQIRSADHKVQIVLKAAYSALYCQDYDTAHRLATQVIMESSTVLHDKKAKAEGANEEHADVTTLLLSLVLDLVSAASFRSWEKKTGLIKALLTVNEFVVWTHPITDLLLERLQRLEAIQSLASELGLSESDLENRREQDQSSRKPSSEDVLLKELELVVDMLREEGQGTRQEDRVFVLRLLQKGLQLVILVQTQAKIPLVPSSPTERARSFSRADAVVEKDQWIARVVPQMAVMALREAYHFLLEPATSDEWEAMMEVGFSYLVLLCAIQDSSDELERVWREEIMPLLSSFSSDDTAAAMKDELFVNRFHHLFLFLRASNLAGQGYAAEDLSSLRVLLDELKYSSSATHHFVHNQPEAEDAALEEEEINTKSTSATTDVFMELAKQCQDLLHSRKKVQELEAVSSFLNDDVDLVRFSVDAEYRLVAIRRMSTKREQLSTAKGFASKYGIDEYECVLAYIWRSFFPAAETGGGHISNRQEQLEQAFRGSDESTGGAGDDFLEQALQRPLEFGEFLLRPETGVYESLAGTDHVGILLVLRTILECSKRLTQSQQGPVSGEGGVLPLSKSSSDRVTLLFMCLKRLKEISTSHAAPDFKLVCGASSSHELLHGPLDTAVARDVAMAAISPFLNAKTIKMLTKVLQKLHQMSSSSIVMEFLDATASKIWREHEQQRSGVPPSADLAVYAYESCMPFLSVLSIDHLLHFYRCFLVSSSETDGYDRPLVGLKRYSGLLTSEKRIEVVSDNYSLLKSRVESLRASNSNEEEIAKRTEQLRAVEEDVVEAAFWFVIERIEQQHNLSSASEENESWFADWKKQLHEWFATDVAHKARYEDCILNAFVAFCEHVPSLDLATLPVELALGLTSTPDFIARAIQDIYCKSVSDVIRKVLGADGDVMLASTLVESWATSLIPLQENAVAVENESLKELKQCISAMEPQQDSTDTTSATNSVYKDVTVLLAQSSSPLVREVVTKRQQTAKNGAELSSLRDAVAAQWKSVIAQYEGQENWMTSALLSHVLFRGDASVSHEDLAYAFGLRVKAVCEYLSKQAPSAFDEVLALSTTEVFTQFNDVFDKLMVAIEDARAKPTRAKTSRDLTVAAASLVRSHKEVTGAFTSGSAETAWRCEKETALVARLAQDFGGPQTTDETTVGQATDPVHLWQALLTRGSWDERLMQWYTFVAYDQLASSPATIAEYYERAVADKKQAALSTMLLLVSPFPELREQHAMQLLDTARQLLTSSSSSALTKVRLLELLLLRFDLQVLLQVDGLNAVLLAFFSESSSKKKVLAWTSTPEYYVCRLVVLKEYAAASRFVCALWNVHPMLWDLENARLVLGNYLQSLAAQPPPKNPLGGAVHHARTLAYQHYQQELL